jgi:hypothetical protein
VRPRGLRGGSDTGLRLVLRDKAGIRRAKFATWRFALGLAVTLRPSCRRMANATLVDPIIMTKPFLTLFALAAATQLIGCASIVSGTNQSVSVETRANADPVVGATCKLTNNKGTWFVTTPGSATVHRSFEDLQIRCDKEALDPAISSVKSSTKGMAFGNILFGGLIGAGVDISTGAAYDYPVLITVPMSKPKAGAAAVTDSIVKIPAEALASSAATDARGAPDQR